MNNFQSSKKNSYNKCKQFFAIPENAAVWSGFPRIVDAVTQFGTRNTELDDIIHAQQKVITGVTTDKDLKFVALVKVMVKFARKARVWAEDNNNHTLEEIFDIRKSDFIGIAEDLASEQLEGIRNQLNTLVNDPGGNILAGVNVDAGSIAAIDAANTAYENDEGKPGEAKGERKSATKGIKIIMDNIDKTLVLIDDLLISEYEETHPKMIDDYRNARMIDIIGMNHQGISADITYEDGTEAEGITLKIVDLNKTGISDIDGHVETLRGRIGKYHLEISGPGIVTQTMKASIKRGEINNLEITVKKGSGTTTGTISGKVTKGGLPVAGATVSTASGLVTITDSEGNFILKDVATGAQQVTAKLPPPAPELPQTKTVTVTAGVGVVVDFGF